MNPVDFENLAAFRYQIRKFLRFSKDFLATEGLTPDQYQALLAVRAAAPVKLSIREVAEQLQVRHHSTVGIVDQLVARELVVREVARGDRRKILLVLTDKGYDLVGRLAPPHEEELARLAPDMMAPLKKITGA